MFPCCNRHVHITTGILNMNQVVKCGQCRVEFEHGAHVCHGCRGDVVYGPTHGEIKFAFITSTLVALVGAYNLLKLIPRTVVETLEASIAPASTLALWSMGGACVAAWILAYYTLNRLTRGMVRTFRRDIAR